MLSALTSKAQTNHAGFIFGNTEIIDENESEDGDKSRLDWIEKMHGGDQNTNWRLMDWQTSFEKQLKKDFDANGTRLEKGSKSQDGTWFERGSKNQAGRIVYSEFDPVSQDIYLGSCGGNIWKGSINQNNWSSLNDGLKIADIRLIKILQNNNLKRICVLAGNKFLYSDNNGSNWSLSSGLENVFAGGTIKKVVVTGSTSPIIYLLAHEWDYTNWYSIVTIYKSTDNATSFTKISTYIDSNYGSIDNFDIWTDNYGSGLVYLAENSHFYKIETNNVINKIADLPIKINGNTYFTGNQNTGSNIYLLMSSQSSSFIYGSSDNGISWTYKGSVNEKPFSVNSFTCSSVNPNNLYIGGTECYRSYDGGISWTKVNNWGDYYGNISSKLHADVPSINSYKNDNNEFVLINTDGGSFISYDQLQSVNNISLSNLNVSQYYSVYTNRNNPNVIYAGSQDQGLQIADNASTIGGLDFSQKISGDYGHIVSSDKGQSIWSVYPGFAIYYPNASTSNNSVAGNFPCTGNLWMPPIMSDPTNPAIAYLGGGGINGGTHLIQMVANATTVNYTELAFDFSEGAACSISAIAYSPINKNYWYVSTGNGKFFYSTDAGKNWTKTQSFTSPSSHYFYGASILPSKSQLNKVYIAGSGYSANNSPVYISTDNGKSFSDMSVGLPKTLVYSIDATPSDSFVYAATEVGPYMYNQTNKSWSSISLNSAPDQIYWSVEYIPEINTARFGTYGRGIWDFVTGLTKVTQDIVLNTGWNIISANLVPANLNLKDIFQPLIDAGKLKEVMDEAGKTIENFGALGGWKNNIGNLLQSEGYKVNVTELCTLNLEGATVQLPMDISLNTGWNIISYPSFSAQDAMALFQSLINAGKLKKVIDESGKAIENFGAFGNWKNNIGNLLPGKGYKVNVTSACTLTIPASGTKSTIILPELIASSHFLKCYQGNGTDHININLLGLAKSGIKSGDEIGVFDGGLCVGSAMIGMDQLLNDQISLPASANDELETGANGFTTGHSIVLKLFHDNQEYLLTPELLNNSTKTFAKGESLFAQVSLVQSTGFEELANQPSVKCYPNPFSELVTIEIQFVTPQKLEVVIYDVNGKLVRKLYKGGASGSKVLIWDGKNDLGAKMVPGSYYVRVNQTIEKLLLR